MRPRADPVKRFLSKITVDSNGCHIWNSTVKRDGYGQFWDDGKPCKAHRMAYELFRGVVPEGKHVCHHCDVRTCVNPDHLFLGDAVENIRDMDRKGRRRTRARLTREQVQLVHSLLSEGKPQREIADLFEIDQTAISRIKRGVIKSYQTPLA